MDRTIFKVDFTNNHFPKNDIVEQLIKNKKFITITLLTFQNKAQCLCALPDEISEQEKKWFEDKNFNKALKKIFQEIIGKTIEE